MKNYTIQDVITDAQKANSLQLPDGKYPEISITAITVKILKLWPAQQKTGAHGMFYIQNGEVGDETGKVKLNIKYRDPLPYKVGDEIILKSNVTAKGISGVSATWESYMSKSTGNQVSQPVLVINKHAIVVQNGLISNAKAPVSHDNPKPMSTPPQTVIEAPRPQVVSPQQVSNISLNDQINKYGELYDNCYDRVVEALGDGDVEEKVKTITGALFLMALKGEVNVTAQELAKSDIEF